MRTLTLFTARTYPTMNISSASQVLTMKNSFPMSTMFFALTARLISSIFQGEVELFWLFSFRFVYDNLLMFNTVASKTNRPSTQPTTVVFKQCGDVDF